MKFLDEKISKIVEKFTIKATKVAEERVNQTIHEGLESGLDSLVKIGLFAVGMCSLFDSGDTEQKKPQRRHCRNDCKEERYVVNITNYYYTNQRKGEYKHDQKLHQRNQNRR